MGIFIGYMLTLLLLVGTVVTRLCPRVKYETIDWEKFSNLNGTWYDIIDNPQYEYLIDCWDWNSFIAIDDGFAMNATQHAEGRPVKDHLDVYLHFLPNGDGTYSVNQTHKSAYASTTKESLSHKADEKLLNDVDVVTEIIFSAEYFFVTDYSNYFVVAQCDPKQGLTVFIKNRRTRPDGQDILNIWNLFTKHKEFPRESMMFKQTCINRPLNGGAEAFCRFNWFSLLGFLIMSFVISEGTFSPLLS